jgi:hypothetical protein
MTDVSWNILLNNKIALTIFASLTLTINDALRFSEEAHDGLRHLFFRKMLVLLDSAPMKLDSYTSKQS